MRDIKKVSVAFIHKHLLEDVKRLFSGYVRVYARGRVPAPPPLPPVDL